MYSKIQYISSGETEEQQLERIVDVLQKGADWIQLRFKNKSMSAVLDLSRAVKLLQKKYDFTFIINDHTDIAAEVDANGVHLGLQDEYVALARQKLGSDKIIGGTANTLSDVQRRIREGCDYIGVGPLRFTKSKEKLSPILGLEGYRHIMHYLKDKLSPPIYAIGGVTLDDFPHLSSIGLHGVAMSGYLEQKHIPHLSSMTYLS